VEKIEGFPALPTPPPPPTVIEMGVEVIGNSVPVLNPPAPPPPAINDVCPPPPPATTTYSTVDDGKA
jgi:hypothetical protein